jgi:integrase
VQGSIQKRPLRNGKIAYLVRVELPPDPTTGKRHQRSKQVATRKAADTLLATWLAEVERGTAVEPSKLTVGEYLRDWLPAHRAAKRLRLTTYTGYELLVHKHIIPALGGIPLQQLTPKQVQDFYTRLLTEGRLDGRGGPLSPRTVQYAAMILKQALARAVALQLVARNAAAAAQPPSAPRRERASWSAEQARAFLASLEGEHYGTALLVSLSTGLRRGEVLGLRWQDVDLEDGTLHVRQTLTSVRGQVYLGPPKTPTSIRDVPLYPAVVSALQAHRKQQLGHRLAAGSAWTDLDLVFCTHLGGMTHPRNLYRRYQHLVKAAELPPLPLHGLRHTFASLLYEDTKDLLLVSRVLGHASPAVTANVYAHLLPKAERRAASAIGRALFPTDGDAAAAAVNLT